MDTIDSLIRESCDKFGDKAALRHKVASVWREVSYSELWHLSDRIAAGLIRSGFKTGQHAALLAPSSPRWVAAYLGILKAGGVVVPIDKELKRTELRHILADSDTRLVFSAPPCHDLLLKLIRDLPALERVVMLEPPGDSAESQMVRELEALLQEWQELAATLKVEPQQAQRIKALEQRMHRLLTVQGERLGAGETLPGAETAHKRISRHEMLLGLEDLCHDAPLPANPRQAQDTAVILYTSGTTGRAKGAMLSHANIISNIRGAIDHLKLDNTIHTLSFLPINHVFEQVCGVLIPLTLGGTVSFCESLKKLGDNLAEVKPSFLLGVPAVYRMLLERIMKGIEARRIPRLLFSFSLTRPLVTAKVRRAFGSGTIFISGGAALDPAVSSGLAKLGLTIYQGYGITETSPIISAEKLGKTKLGTVGQLLPGVEVRIDKPGDEQVGEILARGPNVMQGYYKNPRDTAEVLEDGWYRTGDLGRLDGEGFLTICGRVKNLIVTPNGKNVYPEEVEIELLKSPFIAEAMVYGHRMQQGKEEVHAIIYPNQEALDEHFRAQGAAPMSEAGVETLLRSEVQAACSALADYKRVRRFTVREEEFPKTTTRKIKRFAVEASISTES